MSVDINSRLIDAVSEGKLGIVKILLDRDADIEAVNEWGETPLLNAIEHRNMEIIKLLVNRGANVNAPIVSRYSKYNNLTPLYIATKHGYEKIVKLLLDHGANVDAQDKDGTTVLQCAVKKGYCEIVKHVLKCCPDVNNKSNKSCISIAIKGYGAQYKTIVENLFQYGFTVNPEDVNDCKLLLAAVEKGYLKLVEDLLKSGADVNILFSNYYTPLNSAIENKQEEIVTLLINSGANVNAEDKTGNPPIFYAIENRDLKITKLLLTNGANVKDRTDLLSAAINNKCKEIVEILLQHNADINTTDEDGLTALHFTVLNHDDYKPCYTNYTKKYSDNDTEEIVRLLLSSGANVNAQTKKGTTTLHVAAQKGNVVIIKLLLNKGANVNAKQQDGRTSLHMATKSGNKEAVEVLLQSGAEVDSKTQRGETPLHIASELENVVIIKLLLNKGANVNAKLQGGTTSLHIASEYENKEIVEALLQSGAEIDSKTRKGETPLHYAVGSRNVQITKLLLNKGANVNAKEEDGTTSLHIASKLGNKKIVQVLLQRGAEVDSKTQSGTTPLHVAAQDSRNLEIVKILLNFNADIDSRDEHGETALHVAVKAKHKRIVEVLLDCGSDINIMNKKSNSTPLNLLMKCAISYYGNLQSNVGDIIEILKKHVVKLQTANLYVCDRNLLSINSMDYFKIKCEEEISKMKSEKIIMNNNVSFHDILTKNINLVAAYARNESLVQVLKSNDYKTKFPLYAGIINCHFKNGVERKELLEQGFNIIPGLPYNCAEKIFYCLSNKDIRMVIDAYKPSNVSSPSTRTSC